MVILNQVWWPASQQGNFLIVLSLSPFRLLHWFASSSKGARVFQSRVLKPLFKKGEIRQTKNQDKSKPRQDKTWNNYKYKRVQIWGYVNGWKGEGIIKSAGLAREPILHPPSFFLLMHKTLLSQPPGHLWQWWQWEYVFDWKTCKICTS